MARIQNEIQKIRTTSGPSTATRAKSKKPASSRANIKSKSKKSKSLKSTKVRRNRKNRRQDQKGGKYKRLVNIIGSIFQQYKLN